jgi:hypothetical protein
VQLLKPESLEFVLGCVLGGFHLPFLVVKDVRTELPNQVGIRGRCEDVSVP